MSTDQSKAGTPEDVQDLLDVFCYALGAGAQMRIKRDAIRWLRTTFQPSLESMVSVPGWEGLWRDEATNTFQYVTTIGRLAAQKATTAGMPHIGLKLLDEAIWNVIEAVTRGEPGRVKFGRPCSGVKKREMPIISS